MADIVVVDDLPEDVASNAMVDMWVAGANAHASRVAPCLASTDPAPTAGQLAEARLVLVGALTRWSLAGSGGVQSQAAGDFSVTFDTRQRSGFKLWPSEITQLQDICKSGSDQRSAFSVDTVGCGGYHDQACSVYFGGFCSCGADLESGFYHLPLDGGTP